MANKRKILFFAFHFVDISIFPLFGLFGGADTVDTSCFLWSAHTVTREAVPKSIEMRTDSHVNLLLRLTKPLKGIAGISASALRMNSSATIQAAIDFHFFVFYSFTLNARHVASAKSHSFNKRYRCRPCCSRDTFCVRINFKIENRNIIVIHGIPFREKWIIAMETIVLCACGKCPHRNLVFCFPSHSVHMCIFSFAHVLPFAQHLPNSHHRDLFIFGHIFSVVRRMRRTVSVIERRQIEYKRNAWHGMAFELKWNFKNKTTIDHSNLPWRNQNPRWKENREKSILSENAVHRIWYVFQGRHWPIYRAKNYSQAHSMQIQIKIERKKLAVGNAARVGPLHSHIIPFNAVPRAPTATMSKSILIMESPQSAFLPGCDLRGRRKFY